MVEPNVWGQYILNAFRDGRALNPSEVVKLIEKAGLQEPNKRREAWAAKGFLHIAVDETCLRSVNKILLVHAYESRETLSSGSG